MIQIRPQDRAILIGVGQKSESFVDLKESLFELEELARAAGAEVVGSCIQKLHQLNPATLIGSGKLEEIVQMVKESGASLVVMDHQLSGVQARNLSSALGVRVLDRNQLILDIFALRAHTYEGKLQVELAQMLDQMPRMVNAWMGSLSRLGGGVGTRGPGETALEMDRRRIRDRVKTIRKRLESVRNHRSQHRAARKKNGVPSFALIGYTNSGKSTLLNLLTKSNVLAQNQVFATLDPTTRKVFLPNGQIGVMTDTVGFIRKLPPQLIEAFKATLEETDEADILLHVVDLASPQMQKQMDTIQQLIREFGWDKKPIIHIFNKTDAAPFSKQFQVKEYPRVFISAETGDGIDRLKGLMAEMAEKISEEVQLYFPHAEEHRIYDLGRETQITKKESASQGTVCYAHMTPQLLSRWKEYLVTAEA